MVYIATREAAFLKIRFVVKKNFEAYFKLKDTETPKPYTT